MNNVEPNHFDPAQDKEQRASRWSPLLLLVALVSIWVKPPSARGAVAFTLLHTFDVADGESINGLVLGKDGNLYGTTGLGGSGTGLNTGYGTIFRIAPDGTFTTLYSFSGTDGYYPGVAGGVGGTWSGIPLVQGTDGNFYGTTLAGGIGFVAGTPDQLGNGTIFKITPDGVLTTLVSFDGTNGSNPTCLLQGSDGNFYGIAGSVFKMTPDGSLTTLTTNGYPNTLIQGKDGNFYGTTVSCCPYDLVSVVKITPDGALTTVASFSDTNTGPPFSLMQASDGSLYGTTASGGRYHDSYGNYFGTLFRVTPGGDLTNLVSFNRANGAAPFAALIEGTDGNLYGTTYSGGYVESGGLADGIGTLFKMTAQGNVTSLFEFNGLNGNYPTASLVQASDGSFYGTTSFGGPNNPSVGVVFRLSVPGADTPKIINSGRTGSSLSVTWLALVGRSYQLQSSTDLTQTNWSNAGGIITATNTKATVSDNGSPDPQRFYRVVLLP